MTESNRIEYKRELSDSFEKDLVAFLNYADDVVAKDSTTRFATAYTKDVFSFSSRFVRIILPISEYALRYELLENSYDSGA